MSTLSGNVVGIDYHEKSLRLCVMSPAGKVLTNRSCANDVGEVIEIVNRFGQVRRVSAEACNGSTEFLEALNRSTGWQKRLCHPGYVQRMKNNPDKTDKSDAELIADLDRVDYLPQVWFAPREIRDLRTLVRYRSGVLEARKKAKLRIRSLLRQHRLRWDKPNGLWTRLGIAWLRSLTDFPVRTLWVFSRLLDEFERMSQEQKAAEKQLKDFAESDPLCSRLLSEPGIGLITATVMRAEIADFNRFRIAKQLSRFCGLTPRNASSGDRQADAGMIRAGNPLLKTTIIEATHRLLRKPEWHDLVSRLKQRGKPYPVIVSTVANRWVRQLFWKMKEFQRGAQTLHGGAELESLLG